MSDLVPIMKHTTLTYHFYKTVTILSRAVGKGIYFYPRYLIHGYGWSSKKGKQFLAPIIDP